MKKVATLTTLIARYTHYITGHCLHYIDTRIRYWLFVTFVSRVK
ncbi:MULTISPECIES: hypothetical protein [Vibrio]|nr:MULTISPECIES: hypothetical protein [Vibrio]MDF4280516.1 hypothetical protein [Vibrio parahaemolyticus]MDW2126616.1 hypothetical protein [Vibrio sp. 2033]